MRARWGAGLVLGLGLLAFPDAAKACSASDPLRAILTAPVFEEATRIQRAVLDVTCENATCRFEARYFLERAGTRAALALRGGSELGVHAGTDFPNRRIGDWLVVEFLAGTREIAVSGAFSIDFLADPCVGPGYLARHRFLGTEGRPLGATFAYVVPDRSVRHAVRVKQPAAWTEVSYVFEGALDPPPPEASLVTRALRRALYVRNARDEGKLEQREWTASNRETSFRFLQVWFTRTPFPIQHAGPMLAAGYRFDVQRPWFRASYQVAAPSWLVTDLGVESDLRDHAFVVPSLELTTGFGHGGGDHDTIFGAGAGAPIELTGDSRVFGRLFVTASMTSFGLYGSVDYAPKTHDASGNALAAIWF